MRRECRECFPRHRLQRKLLSSDPGMHHGTCVTHVPWCMSGSLTRGGGENVPGIPGACATRNSTYLVRGPLESVSASWHGNASSQHYRPLNYEKNPSVTDRLSHTMGQQWSFSVFFVVILNKLLNKQSRYRRFETSWRSCGAHGLSQDKAVLPV